MIDVNTLLCDMVKAIVDNPDEVSVTETVEGDSIILNLNVAEGDVGMVIGKHGTSPAQSGLLSRQPQSQQTKRSRLKSIKEAASANEKHHLQKLFCYIWSSKKFQMETGKQSCAAMISGSSSFSLP